MKAKAGRKYHTRRMANHRLVLWADKKQIGNPKKPSQNAENIIPHQQPCSQRGDRESPRGN